MRKLWRAGGVGSLVVLLTGCGASLPVMDVQHADENRFDEFVKLVVGHVRCELGQAVVREMSRPLLKTWGAKVALNIRALDKGTANPSVTVSNAPMNFSFFAGGQLESDATREMTTTYYLPFEELIKEQKLLDPDGLLKPCGVHDGKPIAGDLGIYQGLESSLQAWDGNLLSQDIAEGKTIDTITYHVSFVVQGGLSINPSWKFTRVTADTAGSLLGANRTETNDLLITMGPTVLKGLKVNGKPILFAQPSTTLDQSFEIERLRSAFQSTGR